MIPYKPDVRSGQQIVAEYLSSKSKYEWNDTSTARERWIKVKDVPRFVEHERVHAEEILL